MRYLPIAAAFIFLAGVGTLRATLTVTSMSTTTTSGSPSSSEGYTFGNAQQAVSTFTTPSSTYGIASQANNVFVRRNAVNNNQSSVWYTSSGTGTNLSGIHQSSYGQLLSSNNIFMGSDNTFANGTTNTTGNIERLDFTWNSGLTVTNSLAFAVFDRGAVGVHDSFAIAAVTAIDDRGTPPPTAPSSGLQRDGAARPIPSLISITGFSVMPTATILRPRPRRPKCNARHRRHCYHHGRLGLTNGTHLRLFAHGPGRDGD